MFTPRRVFWAVASRAASSPLANRNATIARQSNFRLFSSEASAPQEKPAESSQEKGNATSSSSAEAPASNGASQSSASAEQNSTKPQTSIKPAYPSPAPKPTAKASAKPPPKPQAKPEPKSQAKPAPKPAPKPEPKSAPKPAAKPESNSTEKSINHLAAAVQSIQPNQPTFHAMPVTVAREEYPSHAERLSSMSVDWATSYHGISSRPVTEKQFEVLMAPIAIGDIEVKPDGIIYLPEIKYRRRLNQAFGPMGWGMIPRGEAVVGDNIVTREYALIVGGRFVAQAQGENQYFSAEQLPSSVEGCKSNALMRCCKDLGIASELWDPTFIRKFRKLHMEAHWVEHANTGKKRQMWFRKGCVEVAYPYKLPK